jgi:hypothetical protein
MERELKTMDSYSPGIGCTYTFQLFFLAFCSNMAQADVRDVAYSLYTIYISLAYHH